MSTHRLARTIWWGSVGLLGQTYVGYPILVALRARRHGAEPVDPAAAGPVTAPVAVIIAAHNEEASLPAKLASVLAADPPAGPVEILVASDGSSDATTTVAAATGDPRVRVLDLPRGGKAAALEAAIAATEADLLVFTDANSQFELTTLQQIVAPFADPAVGGVAGDQRYRDGEQRTNAEAALITHGERRYWQFDRALKRGQTRAGSAISSTGALHAIRRQHFHGVPGEVTDDFWISTGVIADGARLVFHPEAAVWEPPSLTGKAEYRRKVRIMTRGFRSVLGRRRLLRPTVSGFYAVQLLHHKLLRRLMGFPMVTLLAASLVLRHRPGYRAALAGQGVVYALAACGLLAPDRRLGRNPASAALAYLVMSNAAGVHAATNVLRGVRIQTWEPARA